MKKNLLFVFLVLSIAMILTISCDAANDQVIVVGQNGIYDLAGAVNAIKENAGHAVIYLNSSTNLYQQLVLPAGLKGLKSVTLASYTGAPVTVQLGGGLICANGVPFTLEQGVTLANGYLIGGKCVAQYGQKETLSESILIINGNADYVIGGGLSMSLGSVSTVKVTNVFVNGNANVIHGGGFAYNGGTADVSSRTNITLARSSNVATAVYGGGYASGMGSYAPVKTVHLISLGNVAKLNKKAGVAENGGNANIGSYSLEPTPVPTATPLPQYTNPIYPVNPVTPIYPSYPENPPVQNQNTGSYTIYVGPNQKAGNLSEAVSMIPSNAGNVVFQLIGNFPQKADVVIPGNRGITSLTITSYQGRSTVTWPEDIGLFANGIPLVITSNVVFSNGVIYGGANVGSGQQSRLQTTYLDIAGSVNKVVAGSKAKGAGAAAHVVNSTLIFRGKASGWLHNGGAALYGGYSAIDNMATLTMMQGATAEQSISGGGYSFGSGSQSVIKDAYMDISGNVVYAVFLGGYADQSATSSTTGQSYLKLQPAANVGQSVWYGGRAYINASVYVDTAVAQISGHVGATVHKEGRASDGGISNVRLIR